MRIEGEPVEIYAFMSEFFQQRQIDNSRDEVNGLHLQLREAEEQVQQYRTQYGIDKQAIEDGVKYKALWNDLKGRIQRAIDGTAPGSLGTAILVGIKNDLDRAEEPDLPF